MTRRLLLRPALCSLALFGAACADITVAPADEVQTDDAIVIVSNACQWTGLVSKDTPDSCAPGGNSPVSSEIRFVPRLGFMDGMSCSSWPQSLTYADVAQSINGVLPNNAVTTDAIWLQQYSHSADVLDWIVFGSKRELVVRRVPWDSQTQGGMAIVADIDAGYGMVLDHRLTCSELDEQEGRCRIRTGLIDGKSVDILHRTEPSSAVRQSVMLVAETVRFHESIDLDVNLSVMASEVVGGPRTAKRSADGSTRGGTSAATEGVEVQVFSGRSTIGNTWVQAKASLGVVPPRPVLAVFANSVKGVEKFRSKTQARVETLELTPASTDILASAWQSSDSNRIIQATIPKILPQVMNSSVDLAEDNGWKLRHNVTVEFSPPPQVRLKVPGGVAQLGTVAKVEGITVQAHGESRVDVVWDPSEVQDYAGALATALTDIPEGCDPIAPGEDICWMEHDCWWDIDGVPHCMDHEVCQPGPPIEACHVLYSLAVKFPDANWVQINGNVNSFAAAIRDGILQTLDNAYPSPAGPVKFPGGEVRKEYGFLRTNFAAHAMSHGHLFDVLYAAADNRSRRHGLPAEEWEDLGRATDPQVLLPAYPIEDYGIDRSRWLDVQRRRIYVDTFDKDSSTVYLNGLNLPYGRRSVGWHPTHLTSTQGGAYGSMIELSERWATLPQLAQELDDIADDQDFLDVIDDLIALTTQQAELSHETATALGDSAEANAARQTAAINTLETVAQEVIDLQEDFEDRMTSIWGCPGGLLSCEATIAQLAAELETQCEDSTGLGSFVEVVSFLSTVVGYVVPAASAVSDIMNNDKLIDFLEEASKAAGQASAQGAKVKAGLEWIAGKKKVVATLHKSLTQIKKMATTLAVQINEAQTQCEGTPIETQLTQLEADLALMETTAGLLATQSGTLEGILDSLGGHVQHLLSSAHAHQVWADDSDRIIDELGLLQSGTMAQLERQRRFIRAACETTQLTATQAFTDYKAVSDTLVTVAGRAKTSPHLVVPRSPALSNEVASDRIDGFAVSVWDTALFSVFDETGGPVGTTPFLTAARDRFAEFVGDEICRLDGGPLDTHRWLVRKMVTGEALASMLAAGRLHVEVTLDDLLAGGEASGTNFSAVETVSGGGVTYPLSGAVLLNVGYSACFGPANDPCCTGRGCRAGFGRDQPHLVQQQRSVPTLVCTDDTEDAEGTESTSGLAVETCLATTSAHPAHASLTYVASPGTADSLLLESHVDAPLCDVAPAALAMRQLRGLPALGVYEFAPDGVTADGMATALRSGPSVSLSPAWIAANAALTGIELFFFVGAESKPSGPVYDVQ